MAGLEFNQIRFEKWRTAQTCKNGDQLYSDTSPMARVLWLEIFHFQHTLIDFVPELCSKMSYFVKNKSKKDDLLACNRTSLLRKKLSFY